MTDRELLERAAKAAGINWQNWTPMLRLGETELGEWPYDWNPLADDGDALRLAVKLGFYLDIERPCGIVDVGPGRAIEEFPFDDLDAAQAATRRAIVRAAAQMGE